MTAKIEEVCIGQAREVLHNGERCFTGIFKYPVSSTVAVELESLQGDEQVDRRFHGGRDKAIYVYPQQHYSYWKKILNKSDLGSSFFGENLTVSGLNDETVCIGDRYKVGTAIVIVSQPRIPCFKLGIRTNIDTMPARFLSAGWLGFYLRVIETGSLKQGDEFVLLERDSNELSVRDLWDITFIKKTSPEMAAKAIAVLPFLDDGWKKRLGAIAAKN